MENNLILAFNYLHENLNALFLFLYYVFIHYTKYYLYNEENHKFSEENSYENYIEMVRLEQNIETDLLLLNPVAKFILHKMIVNLSNDSDESKINTINVNFESNYLSSCDEYDSQFIVFNNNNYYMLDQCSSLENFNFFQNTNPQECFIFIEYTHPKMTNTIELEIPTNMLNTNNVLFKPSFVKWFLEKCNKNFVFDMDYKINFVDTNLENFTIDSKQYIKITDTNYKVLKNSKNYVVKSDNVNTEQYDDNDDKLYTNDTYSSDESNNSQYEDEQQDDCNNEQIINDEQEQEQEQEQDEEEEKDHPAIKVYKKSWFW